MSYRITVISHDTLFPSSPSMKKNIFGSPSLPKYDGIHLRGMAGSRLLTQSIVEGVRTVGGQ